MSKILLVSVNILKSILGGLVKAAPFLFAYFKGRKDENSDYVKDALKVENTNNAIEDANKVKSDAQILNELKERDTRDEA